MNKRTHDLDAIRRSLLATGLVVGLAACGFAQRRELPGELDGAWLVQKIAGASLGKAVEVHLGINADTGVITGFTGCARFTTSMTSFSDALAVGAIETEPDECASPAAATDQARFLGVVPYVQRYGRRGKSLELLPQGHGEALVQLRVDDFITQTSVTSPSAEPL